MPSTRRGNGITVIGSHGSSVMSVSVGVLRETVPGERRVALVPETVKRLAKQGVQVAIETGAGSAAFYPDEEYVTAGAQLRPDRAAVLASSAVVPTVQPPDAAVVTASRPGTVFLGFMNPGRDLEGARRLRDGGFTAFAMELVPRISRAQAMDALSSQATVAGYEAALMAARQCPRFFPMLTTAAGTIRPARVLILGAGVAGLMAIATARRLGALVEAYDVRRAAGEQVRSLGAKFLELAINAEGQGGYARELTAEEKAKEQEMVSSAVAQADVVITTANVPGRRAPLLVRKETVARMRPGAVIVDLAAESGGNCELTRPGERVDVHGVTVLGPSNLPSELAHHSSEMYSRNLSAFLALLVGPDGTLVTDYSDEILAGSLFVHGGEVRHAATREALGGGSA